MRNAALLTLVLLCLAAPAAAQTPTYSDVTEVNVVEIPVQVLLDGKPVRDLKADNFVVYQDKGKQPVTGFEAVDLYAIPDDKAREVPVPARRHFLLLFDLAFSEPKAIVQSRAAAKDLLTGLHASDLVAVSTYAPSHGSELVLGFTSDRGQIEAAIDSLGLPELMDRTTVDPLRIYVDELRQKIRDKEALNNEGSGTEKKVDGDALLLEYMEPAMRAVESATTEVQKDKITAFTRSFTDLARLMRSVNGRKHVVLLSEGYDSSLLLGSTEAALGKEMQDASEKGELWKVDTQQRFGSGSALNEVEGMLEELRRADCTVQAVDIGGLRGTSGSQALGYERKGGRDSLFQLARDTGGELYENTNDLSAAMGKMLERTGVTYVLTIQPETPPDGAYHALKVELRGLPRGARVVHRPGYFAPKPFAQRSRMEKMLLTAGQVLAGEEGGQVRTSVMTTAMPSGAGSEGTADVPVLVEIDGPSLLHLHQGNDLPAEIYIYAVDSKGQVGDYIAQTLTLDMFKVEAKLLQAGLKFYGHLELPPGSYTTRVLVRNGRTGFHGLRVENLEVPSFAGAAPAADPILLPPFFPEAKGEWLVAREAQRPGRRPLPMPFRMGDQPFLPAAMPILGTGEARFALLGYNLADEGDLQVRSQVLTADGREVQAGDLSLVSRAAGEAGADRLELSFRPPSLKPGEYLLRVTVTDAAGKAGTATTPFVVAAAGPAERG